MIAELGYEESGLVGADKEEAIGISDGIEVMGWEWRGNGGQLIQIGTSQDGATASHQDVAVQGENYIEQIFGSGDGDRHPAQTIGAGEGDSEAADRDESGPIPDDFPEEFPGASSGFGPVKAI